MILRDATPHGWPAIWPFLHDIVVAGETHTLPRDLDEQQARALWMGAARTLVATDDDGCAVLGSAKFGPNQPGPGRDEHPRGDAVDVTRVRGDRHRAGGHRHATPGHVDLHIMFRTR